MLVKWTPGANVVRKMSFSITFPIFIFTFTSPEGMIRSNFIRSTGIFDVVEIEDRALGRHFLTTSFRLT